MSSKTDMIKSYLSEFNKLVPDEWSLPASREKILIIRLTESPYDLISIIKNHIFFTTPCNWSITIVFDLDQTDMSLLKDIAYRYKNVSLVVGSKDTSLAELDLPPESVKIYSDSKSFVVRMYDERSPYIITEQSRINDKNLFKILTESISDIRSTVISSLSKTTPQYTDEYHVSDTDKCLLEAL
jgi:hypothetical protein